MIERAVDARLRKARVARLATSDAEGRPHIVPVCYAYDGRAFYTPVDLKPKRVPAERLARVRNIRAHPGVALVVDEYHEEWDRLWYILVRGQAAVVSGGNEREEALRLLREKYPQYAAPQLLPEDAPVIRIVPVKITSWGRL